ncbi:tail collar [Burkholderia phage BcepSauron]|uniref:Tail collar n=1 Tax=Burkholderia phage BcepSauron TaxID=2530033 RepID=A0A482MLY2_9CAUD|nr:tail fiber protein [Burkholderia phage BcepSauron]QBQ74668.1 tail collar [Burkholderia phage BcepSauron]
MFVQLTTAGEALIRAATGPITITSFKIGDQYNYTPSPSDVDIHGNTIYEGVPTAPFVVNPNVVKYSAYLDYSLGPFAFGEIGMYVGNTLFSLAVSNKLITKESVSSPGLGNAIRIDEFLSVVDTNYEMWLDTAESNNQFRMAVLGSPDQLPQSSNATPNAYIITGVDQKQSAFIAYTDRSGLWNFDAYDYAYQALATITGVGTQSVKIALADYVPGMSPAYTGEIIAEFATGQNFSFCRYVTGVITTSTDATLQFSSPLAQLPAVGDKIVVFGRQALSTTIPNLPIATHTDLGAVIVGNTLTITPQGVLDVNSSIFPVTSVNGKTGDVNLKIGDIPDAARVAATGDYNDLINKPVPYTLPVATTTTLGGVKAPTNGHITIAGDGTIDLGISPVMTVNGVGPDANGNVVVQDTTVGLVHPTRIPAAADMNAYKQTGLFFVLSADVSSLFNKPNAATDAAILEVAPFTTTGTGGDVVQTWKSGTRMAYRACVNNTWGAWNTVPNGSIPIATTTTLGAVIVGAGLTVDSTGLLKTQIQTVNGYSNANIVLSASDVGAIPTTQKGQPGGVATLDQNTGSAGPTDGYVYGRVPRAQLPLGAVYVIGDWDASANHVSQYQGLGTIDPNTALLTGGQQTIDTAFRQAAGQQVYQTVPGNGSAYRVTVAGTTSLDGTSSWAVGDMVLAFNTNWIKVSGTSPAQAYDIAGGVSGTMTASQIVLQMPITRAVTLPAGLTGSSGYAQTGAAAATTFNIQRIPAGSTTATTVGTINWAVGANRPTFTMASALNLAAGDTLLVVGPLAADTALASAAFTLKGSA